LPDVIAVAALAAMCAVVLVWKPTGVVRRPPGPGSCTAPSNEAQLLLAYQREPMLATAPVAGHAPPSPAVGGTYHYCQSAVPQGQTQQVPFCTG
jgi:hypothetical protein